MPFWVLYGLLVGLGLNIRIDCNSESMMSWGQPNIRNELLDWEEIYAKEIGPSKGVTREQW